MDELIAGEELHNCQLKNVISSLVSAAMTSYLGK